MIDEIRELFDKIDSQITKDVNKMTEWAENGKTILISSHILHDIQSLTDNIALINNGKMLAHGNRHEIRNLINVPRPISIVPVKDGNLRKLAKEKANVITIPQ